MGVNDNQPLGLELQQSLPDRVSADAEFRGYSLLPDLITANVLRAQDASAQYLCD
ncbi:MAG: hypothetical protein ABI837_09430 [Acidobacteriota bacterium]